MGTRQPPVDLNVKLVSGGAVLKLKLLEKHLLCMVKKYKTITSVKYKIYKVAALYLFSYISHYLCVTLHNYCCFGGQCDDLATREIQHSLSIKGQVNKVL